MEQQVTVMQWYVVTGTAGATVSTPEGVTLCTIPDGGQGSFFAITPIVVTSDASVSVVKATFNYAPAKLKALGLLGGGSNALPAGYLAAEFLATTTETAQLSTGIEQTRSIGVHARYLPIGGNPYSMVLTPWVSDGKQVRFPTANTQFIWLAQNFIVYGSVITDAKGNFKESGILEYNGQTTNITSWDIPIPPGEFKLCNKCAGQFYFATFTEGEKVIAHYIPALELTTGEVGLFDTVRKTFNVLQAGVGMTLAQALNLGKLPAGGGTLTVSLPSNYVEDEGVLNARAEAEAKGWQITVQTYEAEARAFSTFALRRIWVRKTQDEYGSYVAADGSRWRVDWCVDIWGADPQELGYEPFRSVDAAVAYWELVPCVYPEEELLTKPTTNEYK